MASDHVHERGGKVTRGNTVGGSFLQCKYCDESFTANEWFWYYQAIADIITNGLPDHEERLAAIITDRPPGSDVTGIVSDYRRWQKEASDVPNP